MQQYMENDSVVHICAITVRIVMPTFDVIIILGNLSGHWRTKSYEPLEWMLTHYLIPYGNPEA